MLAALHELAGQLEGELHTDTTLRTLYATDASAYRELPLAVAIPHSVEDLKKLIRFASTHNTSLIPRTAGTSLAGQVVGSGIVVDVSRTFTRILEVNKAENWVRVQPGVVRDELNMHLKPYGLQFGPETSTANRAMVGGMVGNNSCGSNSIVYGSTREHLISCKALLSDGSEVEFGPLTNEAFEQKRQGTGLEAQLYQSIYELLSDAENRTAIEEEFPKPSIPRRNTGYALDMLLRCEPFTAGGEPFNFCKLIAGSEGTLLFLYELKLNVIPLSPAHKALVPVHCHTVDESLRANLVAVKHNPGASELMDHFILECTKNNLEQRKNRFFVQGDPGAILVIELWGESEAEVDTRVQALIDELKAEGLGYHYPIVKGEDMGKIWTLRKAGLGLLSNMKGDPKPVPVIEDTAVAVEDLPAYIQEFNEVLKRYGLFCVHYAHAGSGELHLRPILDLKTEEGNQMFRTILQEIAALVKKYRGSLSGEHGDGRLRGEFIRFMVGEHNYGLLKRVKYTWDPQGVFNPNKIVDTPPMNSSLRFRPGQTTPEFDTVFDWSETDGVLRAAEQCNGSADCRKTELSGGTMCPSYMATRNEKHTTRARANILREVLTNSSQPNRFDSEAVKDVMDLCLSCKGCKNECPSNVDVGKLKAEFLQQYQDANGVSLRTRLVANFNKLNVLASSMSGLYNAAFKAPVVGELAKRMVGFAPERSMPPLYPTTLRAWYQKSKAHRFGIVQENPRSAGLSTNGIGSPEETAEVVGTERSRQSGQTLDADIPQRAEYPPESELGRPGEQPNTGRTSRRVYLFCDEFTNYNDVPMGMQAIQLLTKLGYDVVIPDHTESGRTYLSKGLLRDARDVARRNVALLKDLVSEETPLIGLEPSAILSFRDEYLDLLRDEEREAARHIAEHAFLLDEFLAGEIDRGRLTADQFTTEKRVIKLHGHCHQKALASLVPTKKILSLPKNYEVHLIRSGCCGMAGSFGYEKEHYDVSMQVGELVLFPTVRQQPADVIIAAPGTSCRHQIKDGTGRRAKHPAEILWEALV
ncbi:hypothetical protein SAMN05421823_108264 [Catalinimonas alkaloidigena]|uniref:FAD-binding PCMH-type domain-containing protein n=1 Tax=Catalinimonas alkaloidigena TaxID=1075417 RepID=A0A1G9NDU4_9BACT|nr:FAD-binding and (Fe-S)-binding domain-containing protein [Catalinimonas alkaloidigena]SDL84706.1 hypothetical protein SAMN05421823_108264 [Catalinimonas alkaloidigena]